MEYHAEELQKMKNQGMKFMGSAFAGFIAFAVIMTVITCFGWINVAPTEVAVEVDKLAGKVRETPRGVGYHFFNRWLTDMVIYKVAARSFPADNTEMRENKKYTLDLKTNDGQNIEVDLTIIYGLKANEVPLLHQQIGSTFEDQVLLPQIRSEARLAIGSCSAEEIYQGKVRDLIQVSIKSKLQESLGKYPAIQIHDALLRHFRFSSEFERAIEQKKLAAQQVEINKNRALAQEEEAKRQEAEARGLKLKAIQDAEGRAQSAKIEADGERYRLEQEAAGKLANYKADAEGKRLSAEALGGGQNVVALEFAKNIPSKLQVWGIPTGANNTTLMDLNGVFKGMLDKKEA